MDMQGNVVHRWHKAFHDVWPDHPRDRGQPDVFFWRRAFVYPNGDLIAIFEGLGLIKLDRESNLQWELSSTVHHDLEVLPDGDIWVLTREVRERPAAAAQVPVLENQTAVLEDFATRLGPDGTQKDHLSMIDAFEAGGPSHDWVAATKEFWSKADGRDFDYDPHDIYHTNSLTVLRGEVDHPAFRAGNLLVSLRHLDMIAVIDPASRKAVWSLTGATTLQHDPTITGDDRVLVFDNHWQTQRSRVVAFDPATGDVAWEYGTEPGAEMYSETCGSAQSLANGNVLATESDNGRALEITRDGDVVWEFLNPERAGDEKEFVATLFEVLRLPESFGSTWLP
jgi:hypothetical protein